jgi:hypothetical protein
VVSLADGMRVRRVAAGRAARRRQPLPGVFPGPTLWQVQGQSPGGAGESSGDRDQMRAHGCGRCPCVETEARAPAARVRLNAMAAQTSRALLAQNLPEGRCASGPFFRSATTCR